MRKLLIASLMTSAVAVAAHAGSISFDSRADYEAKNYNDAYGKKNFNRFVMKTLRLDAKGNFNEDTSYRLRFRFNKNADSYNNGTTTDTVRTADSLNSSIDFAFLQYKLMDGMNIQMGKMGTDIGGLEGATSGSDMYFSSQSYQEQEALRYGTGVKLMYAVADQEFSLMTVNQQSDAYNGTLFTQTHEAMGLVYKGSIMDKMLVPYVSYFMDDVQTNTNTSSAYDKKYNYMNVGLKFNMKSLFVDADYGMNNYKNKSVLDETDTTTSLVATVGYQLDNWAAKLKYESSEVKAFTAANTSRKTTYTGMGLAGEYMPSGDKNFRYHAAYTTRDTKPETGDTKTEQVAMVGFKLYADFLK